MMGTRDVVCEMPKAENIGSFNLEERATVGAEVELRAVLVV